MVFDHLAKQFDAPFSRNVWNPNEPRMRNSIQVNEFAKVGVNRDQDSVFGLCTH